MRKIYVLSLAFLASGCSSYNSMISSLDEGLYNSPLTSFILAADALGQDNFYRVSRSNSEKHFYSYLSNDNNQMVEITLPAKYRMLPNKNADKFINSLSSDEKQGLDSLLGTGPTSFYKLHHSHGYGSSFCKLQKNPNLIGEMGDWIDLRDGGINKLALRRNFLHQGYPVSLSVFKAQDPDFGYPTCYVILIPGEKQSIALSFAIPKGAKEPNADTFVSQHVRMLSQKEFETTHKGKSSASLF